MPTKDVGFIISFYFTQNHENGFGEKYNGVYITVLFTYRQAEGMLKTSKHTMHC